MGAQFVTGEVNSAIFIYAMPDEFTTPSASNEAELIVRARARSPEAWTEIYSKHYAAVFRYAKARVFDEATAEDLTSAVFVGALKGIDSFKDRGRPLLAFLYRIARNVVASHQRAILHPRHQVFNQSLDANRDGDSAMLVDRLDLRDALTKLPTNQREVVILRFLVGLSAQEVAEVVGKKPAAVYSLQARAILALRQQLR